MGTCRPDLRRLVRLGDQIFVVSGSMGPAVKQYVIGGLEISQKLDDQLAAYEAYPEHRLQFDSTGQRTGNIIVTADGAHDPRDHHDKFDKRIRNYLVGTNPVVLETEREVQLGRERSVELLAELSIGRRPRPCAKQWGECASCPRLRQTGCAGRCST